LLGISPLKEVPAKVTVLPVATFHPRKSLFHLLNFKTSPANTTATERDPEVTTALLLLSANFVVCRE
jgi:hypothetical protein